MAGLEAIPRLDVLDLHSNQIESITHLEHHAELRVLNLAGNQLKSVHNVRGLRALTELNARKNQITTVDELGELPNLQTVFLSENRIETFEDAQSLFSSKSIVDLALEENPICNLDTFRLRSIESIATLRFLNLVKVTDTERAEVAAQIKITIDTRCTNNHESEHEKERKEVLDQIETEWKLRTKRIDDADAWAEPTQGGNLTEEDEVASDFSEVETDGESHKLILYGNSLGVLRSTTLRTSIDSICFRFVSIEAIARLGRQLKCFTKLETPEFCHNRIEHLHQLNWLKEVSFSQLVIQHNPIIEVRFLKHYIATNFNQIQTLNAEKIGLVERAAKLPYSSALRIAKFQCPPSPCAEHAQAEQKRCLKQRQQQQQMTQVFDLAVDKAMRDAMKC